MPVKIIFGHGLQVSPLKALSEFRVILWHRPGSHAGIIGSRLKGRIKYKIAHKGRGRVHHEINPVFPHKRRQRLPVSGVHLRRLILRSFPEFPLLLQMALYLIRPL